MIDEWLKSTKNFVSFMVLLLALGMFAVWLNVEVRRDVGKKPVIGRDLVKK